MVHHNLLLIISLFFLMALLYIISQRIKISYPIFLVIGGLMISFIPQMPNIAINPDMVFLIFLPPLLFAAAWNTSWNSFLKWRRSIFLLGFGLVFFTSLALSYFSVSIIPGFTIALGFLLGGIISPPDAVAASSVLKGVKIPKRGITTLEGESLVNDAASLTIFSFASMSITKGNFVAREAIVQFLELSVMGIFVGLVIGHILYLVLRFWAKSSSITTPITLIAPYLMYIIAEEMHWSGVLAVVSGGLFLSFRSKDFLNYHTRIQTKEVMETIDFLLNGFVFILIGLELPFIMDGLHQASYDIRTAIKYGLIVVLIVILLRIVLVYLFEYIPRWLSPNIRKKEKNPGWRYTMIIGWAGMRGVVSLASALSIPLVLENGTPFPQRNLILFITFVVILVTLVFQGLTLPILIKLLKVEEIDDYIPEEEQLEDIRYRMAKDSVKYLDKNYAQEMKEYESIGRIKEQLQRSLYATDQSRDHEDQNIMVGKSRKLFKKVMLDLIDERRVFLRKIEDEKKYEDLVIRDIQDNLDLEEARLNKQ